ncbi:MAG: baseplate J/gp47 family protein, partial [Deltaproteobacteria bacterium]|nr:baseplate J/gp47 family protein [Deltaproteobacteria bacterium]
MAWDTPTLSELITRIGDDIATRMQDTLVRVRYSLPWTLARTLAGAVSDVHGFLGYLAGQITPKTATDAYLDDHGSTHGITRGAATPAEGFALVTGVALDTLPAASVMTSEDGHAYTTDIAVQIPAATTAVYVPLTASAAGSASNVDGGAELTLASPPAGFSATATVLSADGCTGGTGAAKATGIAVLYAVSGSTQLAASQLVRHDGLIYVTDAAVTWQGTGYRAVAITANAVGSTYNCAAGTALTVSVPGVGVSASANVALPGLTLGTDQQTDDEYRQEILAHLRNPPQGGAKADYVAWAKETPGVDVTEAWVFGHGDDPTIALPEVHVRFVVDDGTGTSTVPSAGQEAEVYDYLMTVKPVTAQLDDGA